MKLGNVEVPKTFLRRTSRKIKGSCAPEMLAFLSALKRNNFDDARCTVEKVALQDCVRNLSTKKSPPNTLNFHMQRLAKKL